MLEELMKGLDYVHSKNICHRDVKPENILLTASQTPILGDFGLAAYMATPYIEGFVGSPEFMAPEILFEDPYNQKVDLWSMGM